MTSSPGEVRPGDVAGIEAPCYPWGGQTSSFGGQQVQPKPPEAIMEQPPFEASVVPEAAEVNGGNLSPVGEDDAATSEAASASPAAPTPPTYSSVLGPNMLSEFVKSSQLLNGSGYSASASNWSRFCSLRQQQGQDCVQETSVDEENKENVKESTPQQQQQPVISDADDATVSSSTSVHQQQQSSSNCDMPTSTSSFQRASSHETEQPPPPQAEYVNLALKQWSVYLGNVLLNFISKECKNSPERCNNYHQQQQQQQQQSDAGPSFSSPTSPSPHSLGYCPCCHYHNQMAQQQQQQQAPTSHIPSTQQQQDPSPLPTPAASAPPPLHQGYYNYAAKFSPFFSAAAAAAAIASSSSSSSSSSSQQAPVAAFAAGNNLNLSSAHHRLFHNSFRNHCQYVRIEYLQ